MDKIKLDSIEDALEDFEAGKLVIVEGQEEVADTPALTFKALED